MDAAQASDPFAPAPAMLPASFPMDMEDEDIPMEQDAATEGPPDRVSCLKPFPSSETKARLPNNYIAVPHADPEADSKLFANDDYSPPERALHDTCEIELDKQVEEMGEVIYKQEYPADMCGIPCTKISPFLALRNRLRRAPYAAYRTMPVPDGRSHATLRPVRIGTCWCENGYCRRDEFVFAHGGEGPTDFLDVGQDSRRGDYPMPCPTYRNHIHQFKLKGITTQHLERIMEALAVHPSGNFSATGAQLPRPVKHPALTAIDPRPRATPELAGKTSADRQKAIDIYNSFTPAHCTSRIRSLLAASRKRRKVQAGLANQPEYVQHLHDMYRRAKLNHRWQVAWRDQHRLSVAYAGAAAASIKEWEYRYHVQRMGIEPDEVVLGVRLQNGFIGTSAGGGGVRIASTTV